MPTVEVDLDDLEALIFVSAAIKNIEGALMSFRRDPFVQSAQGKFIPAQKRLEVACRNAKRSAAPKDGPYYKNTMVHFDEPMLTENKKLLVSLYASRNQHGLVRVQTHASSLEAKHGPVKLALDSLSVRGMIEVGNYVDGGLWLGDDFPIIGVNHEFYMVRFTARGEAEAKRLMIEDEQNFAESMVCR